METSAKGGQRVRDAFLNSARQVLLQIQMGMIDPANTPGVRVSGPESGKVATVYERGLHLMRNPVYNKAEAFTEAEREELGLIGLLPPKILNIEVQVQRCVQQLRTKDTDIGRYIYLEGVHNRNETLYFRLLLDNITDLMPIVYTPSVGQACKDFDRIFRGSRGIYFNLSEKGNFKQVVWNSNVRDADIIVVTDGSRILGLGDLGTNGMGIPIGKLSLYVACAGINPGRTVPVTIDVGTNNPDLLNDDMYLGERHKRIDGEEYYAVVDEFVDAVRSRWPNVLIQFEDFTNDHAFPLLERYRNQVLCFNDDIQGTGAVALAGVLTAMRAKNEALADQRIVFFGAGSAAVGVADCIVAAMVHQGLTVEEARRRFWLVDSRGLVTSKRDGELQEHKVRFCRDDEPLNSLLEVVQVVKPTMLLGLSGQYGSFTEDIIKEMHAHCPAPVIFALSNPTPKAEATPEQLYTWTDGEAWVATGSPFKPVSYNGKMYTPGQGNNMYIFPGVGLAAIVGKFKTIPDSMFYLAAKTLSEKVTEEDLASGLLYPQIKRIRELSYAIAVACVKEALDCGIAQISRPDDLEQLVRDAMWQPQYSRVELDASVLAYSGRASAPRKAGSSKQTLAVSSSESKSFSFSDIERGPSILIMYDGPACPVVIDCGSSRTRAGLAVTGRHIRPTVEIPSSEGLRCAVHIDAYCILQRTNVPPRNCWSDLDGFLDAGHPPSFGSDAVSLVLKGEPIRLTYPVNEGVYADMENVGNLLEYVYQECLKVSAATIIGMSYGGNSWTIGGCGGLNIIYICQLDSVKRTVPELCAFDSNWVWFQIDPRDQPLLLTEPIYNPASTRERATEMLFEDLGIPSLNISVKEVAALVGTGWQDGIVVDAGEAMTSVVPISHGCVVTSGIRKLYLGGADLDVQFAERLARRADHIRLTSTRDRLMLRRWKESVCYCRPGWHDTDDDFDDNGYGAAAEAQPITLPDGTAVDMADDKWKVPESLFHPHLLGIEGSGIGEMVVESIEDCPIDDKLKLYKKIMLAGGTSQFPGFADRLRSEVEHSVKYSRIATSGRTQNRNPQVHVEKAHRHPEWAAWIGGSAFASLKDSFEDRWLSREEYEECGPDAINSKVQISFMPHQQQ
ncbi:Malic enzyme [Perkinsus olseni]|uniref:Malic enzyme n=1 Tax=Perkinsus olseni TaxID=32597 RepID=A0A7J6SP36_PEROL|nr:Malic enzyme [Perkinsus olseni]